MEENNYTVYAHKFPDGKYYIGLTKQDPDKRWNNGKKFWGIFRKNMKNLKTNIKNINIYQLLNNQIRDYFNYEEDRNFLNNLNNMNIFSCMY